MEMDFYKLQACGNDFILLNQMQGVGHSMKRFAAMARRMCPYHTGIGANGLIVLVQGREHRVGLHVFGQDGTESSLLNDAVICAGRYLFDNGFIEDSSIIIETVNGVLSLRIIDSRNFRLSLGNPATIGGNDRVMEVSDKVYSRRVVLAEKSYIVTPLVLQLNGAVVFMENFRRDECRYVSKYLSKSEDFAGQAVPIFVSVTSRDEVRLSVIPKKRNWDIAVFSGLAAVGAIINGFIERDSVVMYDDNTIFVHWNERDDQVYVTASSNYVFTGSYYLED